jgi:hypothetical protein
MHVIRTPIPNEKRRPGFLLAILSWDQGEGKAVAA